MTVSVSRETVCLPSTNIVAREIEGDLIIVPLVAGIGDLEDELFTLNSTGKVIWTRLDGQRTLGEIAADLAIEYTADANEIEQDVLGLVEELAKRKMVDVSSRS